MIFFCEECGEKNDLKDMPLVDGKVVFQCRGCGYGNAYSADKPGAGPVGKSTLKKKSSFPQVIGLFSYHVQNGLMENQMPAILSRADVETLGQTFTHVHGDGRSLYPDIKEVSALLGDKYFTVHIIEPRLFVVLVVKNDSERGISMNRGLGLGSTIGRIRGVDRHVLVDGQGNLLTHDMETPETLSRLLHLWGQRFSTLGGKNFKFASLSRMNNRDVLMFPVGNCFLGVVKQAGINNGQLAGSVMEFLARHSDRRDSGLGNK